MTIFEKITASPEALGELLDSLTVIESPWEKEFHKAFCADCGQTDCGACPHEKERNNPLWWLVQTAEGEQDTRRAVLVWRNGRLELGPGMIVPLQDEDRHADGTCNEFGGCEDAAEIVALLGKKCKLEVRAAVENWSQTGRIEYHGHRYILEAVPLELKPEPLKRLGGTGVTIGFLVYRYTATVGDTELWSFEWGTQEKGAAPTPGTQERQGGINPGRLRRSEILSLARLFHVSIDTATEYHDILAAQAKQSGVEPK